MTSDRGSEPRDVTPKSGGMKRRDLLLSGSSLLAASVMSAAGGGRTAQAQQPAPAPAQPSGQRPNIVFIMGDDIGWFNIGAYHQGIMASRTPNLDRLAAEGMRFTDYYAEASCTAGRANFITGELPIRTGLTTVGQAGSTVGMPAQAPTIATALKSMGYATGQFGKNHLGDLNEFLPTVHGFDEFYGYLYHLDAMEDPAHRNYPQALKDRVGPRNMVHSWATDRDDPTVQPRWGKIGKQRIEDAGTLYPKRMETVDDEILENTFAFIDKAKRENKPFFVWLNPTRMHVVTHLSEKYENMRNSENGWSISEAGFAQLDDIVGCRDEEAHGRGLRQQHHRRVHDRQRRGELHLAGWRPDAVRGRQGNGHGRRLPRALHDPLAGPGARRQGRERDHLRARLVPDLRGRRRQPEHRRGAQEGQAARRADLQGPPRRLQPDGPDHRKRSVDPPRDFLLHRGHAERGALSTTTSIVSPISPAVGWAARSSSIGRSITNLRLDPFERTGLPNGDKGSLAFYN